jgi:hypothetical protein
MNEMVREERTVAILSCGACASAMLERDKFCRWCGARQTERIPRRSYRASDRLPSGSYATTLLASNARLEVYHRVSAPLVSAAVTSALGGPSKANQSALMKKLILGLISIPIWLIIVLLSPLDAYAAVRDLARQE